MAFAAGGLAALLFAACVDDNEIDAIIAYVRSEQQRAGVC
jgi:hypothetical protein